MNKTGLSIHCHHDILIEHCYNYDKRVNAIKRDKPQSEQEIRLRLFKLLPKEAIDELPKEFIKATAEYEKAYTEWGKAYTEREKAYTEWADKEIWHKKWCGCSEWQNGKISFKKNFIGRGKRLFLKG